MQPQMAPKHGKKSLPLNHSERARLIDFVNRQDGWLLTIDGKNVLRMYQTDDGGITWIAIIS